MCSLKAVNIFSYVFLVILAISCGGFGGWLISQEHWTILIFGSQTIQNVGYVLVGAGILIFLTAIFGCVGTMKESKCCIIMFLTITIIAFIVLLVSATLLFLYNKQVQGVVTTHLKKEFVNKYGSDQAYTRLWDEFQPKHQCCGIESGADYKSTKWYNEPSNEFPREGEVPMSCCTRHNEDFLNVTMCGKSRPEDHGPFIYSIGCWEIMQKSVSVVLYWSSISVFILCGILIFIIVLNTIMNAKINRNHLYGQVV